MDIGTHDYGRDPESSEVQRSQVRGATDAHHAAVRRDNLPTLAELEALAPQVTMPDGAMMPERIAARGDRGWLDDSDRDSGKASQLASLVKDLDALAVEWQAGKWTDTYVAARAVTLWQSIRKLTQEGAAS